MDHGNTTNREIDEQQRVADLEAEIEALRAQKSEDVAELSTRDRSPIKPQDRQRPIKEPRTVEFAGETYTFDVRAAKDTRTMFALRADDMETVLTRVIGEEGLERALKSIEDEDGYADFEKVAELVGAIYEQAGAKNS